MSYNVHSSVTFTNEEERPFRQARENFHEIGEESQLLNDDQQYLIVDVAGIYEVLSHLIVI